MAAGTNFKLFGVKKVIMWMLGQDDALGAAMADTVGTDLTLAAGQGVDFADASIVKPHKIKVGSEKMWVIGRPDPTGTPDVVTVQRGKDGSTAATHLIAAAVRHLIPIRIPKTNAFDMNANIQTIEFPGDGDIERVFQSNGIQGTIGLSKFATAILDTIAGIVPVVAGLPSDVASRYMPELGDYFGGELNVDLKAENETTHANGTVRAVIFLCQLQDPLIIGAAGNNAAQQTVFNWSSEAALYDLWGDPLAGVTTEEVHYAYDILA